MLLIVCFLYCFFAAVLGLYLGLEFINVRKAERMARTIMKAAARAAQSDTAPGPPPSSPAPESQANYFTVK